jgi:hypothetical protein
MEAMALIEIDGLPINSMVDLSMVFPRQNLRGESQPLLKRSPAGGHLDRWGIQVVTSQ